MKSTIQGILAAGTLFLTAGLSQGTVLWSQDFSSGGVPADYDDGVANEFDGITTSGAAFSWSISGNSILGDRSGSNSGALSRTTDLSISPNMAYFQFDFAPVDITTAATSSIVAYLGSNLNTNNSAATNSDVHSRFSINLTNATTEEWTVRDINGGTTYGTLFTGTQKLTLIANNTGSALPYDLGGGVSGTLADDKFDLWVGSTLAFDDAAATTGAVVSITDFKLLWNAGNGTATFDNIVVGSIPEPATIVCIISGTAMLLMRRRRRA
jgi:hypothetical protein